MQSLNFPIGHFRVPKTLTFRMSLGAQPFLWKWVLFAWEWQMISISKAEHLPSFWNRGPGEFGHGLLITLFAAGTSPFQLTGWRHDITWSSPSHQPSGCFLLTRINCPGESESWSAVTALYAVVTVAISEKREYRKVLLAAIIREK